MKAGSFVRLGVLVALGACSQTPAVPGAPMPGAPGVPAAPGVAAPIAVPSQAGVAAPAPSIVPASIPAPTAPAEGSTPVVGIAECDTYVQQACACANESRREMTCRIATMSARAWARLYAVSPTSRDRLVQQCTESAGRLQTTCGQ